MSAKFKKRVVTIASCSLAAVLVATGTTLAWFTSKAEAKNVMTFGNVSIKLDEPNYDKLAGCDKVIENVMPGNKICKDPKITNNGSNPCYIRVKLDIQNPDSMPAAKALTIANTDMAVIKNEVGSVGKTGWILVDGYYYYGKLTAVGVFNLTALAPKQSVQVFNSFTVPTSWENADVKAATENGNKNLNINVNAQAVQSDNFTQQLDLTSGWGSDVTF